MDEEMDLHVEDFCVLVRMLEAFYWLDFYIA